VSSGIDTEELADHYVETLKDGGPFYRPMENVLKDYILERRDRDQDFTSSQLFDAIEDSKYNWEELKEDFRIYLEKRIDRNHDEGLENPDARKEQPDHERVYHLGYIEMGLSTDKREAFMTSAIHFQGENAGWALQAEYLDEDEGLEAITHLLENGERGKVRELVTSGLHSSKKEKALKSYEAVASTDLALARELLQEANGVDTETRMRKALFENENVFERFGEGLDF